MRRRKRGIAKVPAKELDQWRSLLLPADRKILLVALIAMVLIVGAVSLIVVANSHALITAANARLQQCIPITLTEPPAENPAICPEPPCTAHLCP